ncbi:MAG TPA: hypothetical protein VD816_07930, partial [Ohtaekwangia sp.]|nr:hypothetical protein [Ohtaekwangia sp.]
MRNRALKYTIGFAVVGLIISLLIAYVERRTVTTFQDNMPYVSLGDNIKNRTSGAHLWFEELLGGDASLDFERDVMAQLNTVRAALQAAYDGKTTEHGAFEKAIDEDTKVILKEGLVGIDKLISTARERWKARQESQNSSDSASAAMNSGAGSQLDQQFDSTYENFQLTMDRLI